MVITILIVLTHMVLSQVLWVVVVVQKEYNQLFNHPEVVLMSLIRFWDFFWQVQQNLDCLSVVVVTGS